MPNTRANLGAARQVFPAPFERSTRLVSRFQPLRWEFVHGFKLAIVISSVKFGLLTTVSEDRIAAELDAAHRFLSLTPREREVIDHIMQGHNNKVIAIDLGLSVRTVEVHRARSLDRLEVRTTAEAVRLATLARLITPG